MQTMMQIMSLETLNTADRADFVRVLGDIFEHSPWVAEAVFDKRPFASVAALHEAMCEVMWQAPETAQRRLVRAHPDLAGRAAQAGDLSGASRAEQASAGLDRLSAEEYRRFHTLNTAYQERFGFPFIIAVKDHSKASILAAFETRLMHSAAEELETALRQIARIAEVRLSARVRET